MLSTDRDGGSLERAVFSVEVDECICYLCDCDQDYLFEDDLDYCVARGGLPPA